MDNTVADPFDSFFDTPCSLFPVPFSLFPVPLSEWQSILTNIGIQANTTDFLMAVKLTSETYD